jgi:hypothetical protein
MFHLFAMLCICVEFCIVMMFLALARFCCQDVFALVDILLSSFAGVILWAYIICAMGGSTWTA